MSHRILLAAVPDTAAMIRKCLGSGYEYCVALNEQAAETALSGQKLDLAIVSYHFDTQHTYRLIGHIRELTETAQMPILLVRARQYQNHASVEQTTESYKELGVTSFFPFYEEEQRIGIEKTAQEFRDLVSLLLSAGATRIPDLPGRTAAH